MKERAVEIIAAYVRKNQVTQANPAHSSLYLDLDCLNEEGSRP
jgi:hypothetical protein